MQFRLVDGDLAEGNERRIRGGEQGVITGSRERRFQVGCGDRHRQRFETAAGQRGEDVGRGQQHLVDRVDDPVGRDVVAIKHAGVVDVELGVQRVDQDVGTAQGGVRFHGGRVGDADRVGNHVVEQNVDQRLLVLGQEQRIQHAVGKCGESRVGRGVEGERTGPGEVEVESGSRDRRRECVESEDGKCGGDRRCGLVVVVVGTGGEEECSGQRGQQQGAVDGSHGVGFVVGCAGPEPGHRLGRRSPGRWPARPGDQRASGPGLDSGHGGLRGCQKALV